MLTFSAISGIHPAMSSLVTIAASPYRKSWGFNVSQMIGSWREFGNLMTLGWEAPGCPMDKYRGWKTTQLYRDFFVKPIINHSKDPYSKKTVHPGWLGGNKMSYLYCCTLDVFEWPLQLEFVEFPRFWWSIWRPKRDMSYYKCSFLVWGGLFLLRVHFFCDLYEILPGKAQHWHKSSERVENIRVPGCTIPVATRVHSPQQNLLLSTSIN